MSAAVEVEGLVKKYGDLTAVAGIDLLVEKGTCLGLLGPNGAGKTTTIEILEGLLPRDGGKVRILGRCWEKEPQQIRLRIGVQLQATRFPDKLTVRETIRTFRALYPEGRDPDELLDLVGLAGKANSRVVQLSGGQHQRLALGCALVGAPELLFLDEPTTGLDPQARRRVWDIVESFKKNGGSVLLTTHYMDEAERLCDQLLIVDEGKVIAKGPPQEIISSLGADGIVEFKPEDDSLVDIAALEKLAGVREVRHEAGSFVLAVDKPQVAIAALMNHLAETGLVIEDLRTHRSTLEDVFVSLTGKSLRDA